MLAKYFSAEWCGPCKPFKPIAKDALDTAGITVVYYDADTDLDETVKYGVRSLPSIVFVLDDQEVARVTGASQKQLSEAIAKVKNG